jgi:aminotransferase
MGQLGAIEALRGSANSVLEMKREYKRRREFVVSRLNEIGLECRMPEGTFYVFPSIKNTGMSSVDFAKKLLHKEKVAVVPGSAFGSQGEGYIRIAYASSMDNLKEAMARIEHFLK